MPSGPQDRVRFRAWILGYNVEELVPREALRPWQMEDAGVLSTGVECHAIHRNGWFQKCAIDKVSPHGTVYVHFNDSAGEDSTIEIPLSHIRIGRFYKQLKKMEALSPAEEQARRALNLQRKREREEVRHQMKADMVAQDSADWQGLLTIVAAPPTNVSRKETVRKR
jgi:hypothetical protein